MSLRAPEALWILSSSHAGFLVYLEETAVLILTFHSLPLNRWFFFFPHLLINVLEFHSPAHALPVTSPHGGYSSVAAGEDLSWKRDQAQ